MRKIFLLLFVIISLAIGHMFYSKNTLSHRPIPVSPATKKLIAPPDPATPNTPQERDEISNRPSENKNLSISKLDIKKLHQRFPDQQQVNEELKTNPHAPSKALMAFAKQLGPLMEKAFENEKDANLLAKELSLCAHDESLAKAARATCVTNTERLGEVYPNIEKEAKELRTSVSDDVKNILDTNDAFIRQ